MTGLGFDPAPDQEDADPQLPPLLTPIKVESRSDPAAKAFADALREPEPGRFYWSEREDVMLASVVLAPEEPMREAARMLYAGALGVGDSLGALAPPETAVTFVWPDRIAVNQGWCGSLRIASTATSPDEEPDFLVLSLGLMLTLPKIEPGHRIDLAALHEEGCGHLTRTRLIESWARHLLVWIHRYQTDGFRPLHDAWKARASDIGEQVIFSHGGNEVEGMFLGIDEDGQMLLRGQSTQALALTDLLNHPASFPWQDT